MLTFSNAGTAARGDSWYFACRPLLNDVRFSRDGLTSEKNCLQIRNISGAHVFYRYSRTMANTEKATRMEDILKATQNKNTSVQDKSAPVQNKDAPKSAPREPAEKRERLHIPRGKPKSGKIWKEQKTK